MATASTEIERKYSVDAAAVPPDVTAIGLTCGPVRTHELSAVYLDTPELTLTRNRITLRRRTGGDDAGWHLKLPKTAEIRGEIHAALAEGVAPAGDDDGVDLGGKWTVPAVLVEHVAQLVGSSPLRPVAVLANRRDVCDLFAAGAGERAVAEFCDDRVGATSIDPQTGERDVSAWREWEIELVAGTTDFFEELEPLLTAAGAVASDSPSKLARALEPVLARRRTG